MEKSRIIHLTEPNTLSQYLSEKERQEIVSLKITGVIGKKDFDDVLDDMCEVWGEYDEDDNFIPDYEDSAAIRHLDMGEATYVDGDELPYFGWHTQLETLVLPQGIKSTSEDYESGFSESEMLKTLILPEGLKKVGGFNSCKRLTSLLLPEGLEEIESFAFCGCEAIKAIKLPKSLKKFDGSCFGGCSIESYEIESDNPYYTAVDGVIYSKDLTKLVAFPSAYPHNQFEIPKDTRIIGYSAFMDSCIDSVELPNSLVTIEGWAFQGSSIKCIELPDTITSIGELTFRFCTKLEHVRLPNGLNDIPEQMICHCPNLHFLHIPASVKTIDCTNFAWSYGLTTVEMESDVPPVITRLDTRLTWENAEQTVIVPDSSVVVYVKAPGWNRFIVKGSDC